MDLYERAILCLDKGEKTEFFGKAISLLADAFEPVSKINVRGAISASAGHDHDSTQACLGFEELFDFVSQHSNPKTRAQAQSLIREASGT